MIFIIWISIFIHYSLSSDCSCGSSFFQPNDQPYIGRNRTFYISAEEENWDYVPYERNVFAGRRFTPAEDDFVEDFYKTFIGHVYRKCMYFEYTDATFSLRKFTHTAATVTGPTIRALTGDTIVVHFRNQCRFPVSMHPHGVRYTKANEGAASNDHTFGIDLLDDAINTNDTYTYVWTVPESASPAEQDLSTILWAYHSHVNPVADLHAGLVGAIVIGRPEMCDWNTTLPLDVDVEHIAYYGIFDENLSPFIEHSLIIQAINDTWRKNPEFLESNRMHSINGFVFGNTPLFTTFAGQRARWYVYSFGNEVDLHTAHWHGSTLIHRGSRVDTVQLLPSTFHVLDMVDTDNVGVWPFHCHVDDHISQGMLARYEIKAAPNATAFCQQHDVKTSADDVFCLPGVNRLVRCDDTSAALLSVPECAAIRPSTSSGSDDYVAWLVAGCTVVVMAFAAVALVTLYRTRKKHRKVVGANGKFVQLHETA